MKTFLFSLFTIFAFNLFAQNPEHSIEIDGTKGYIEFEENNTSIDSSFAIMGFFKSNSTNSIQNFVIAKGKDGTLGNWNYNISFKNGSLSFGTANKNTGAGYVTTPMNTIKKDVWHHFVCQKNSGMIYIYVDGICYDSSDVGNLVTSSTQTKVKIGSTFNGNNYFLNGNIDYISIWDRALNIDEIRRYTNCYPESNEKGLVSYFNFEEGSGITTKSLVDNALTADLNFKVTWSDSVPKYNCCLNKLKPHVIDSTVYKTNNDLTLTVANSIEFNLFQWQMMVEEKIINLIDTGRYSGTQTSTLQLKSLELGDDSASFRCITVNKYECNDTSNEVTISVIVNSVFKFNGTTTKINFYPSPLTNDVLHVNIENKVGNYTYEIINIYGQVLQLGTLTQDENTVLINSADKLLFLIIKNNNDYIVDRVKIINERK